ncbi:MAG: hypothetical protein N0E54_17295 [Candidatus Thiodiazotropha taylori]|nr:hypothetical protein [Candidatus Thiodiazotropha endolucinida]MCW4230499.1 hypothetical protein [Candidatus Thiodiazotropha taylori]
MHDDSAPDKLSKLMTSLRASGYSPTTEGLDPDEHPQSLQQLLDGSPSDKFLPDEEDRGWINAAPKGRERIQDN